jgi:hypothetical protein
MKLTPEYLTGLEHRARQFSGAYTGTSGTLAAGIIHLLHERASMTVTIDTLTAANQALRDAVETRLAGNASTPSPAELFPQVAGCCEGGKCQPQADTSAVDGWKKLTQESAEKYCADRSDWILQGQRELEASRQPRLLGAGVAAATDLRPGSREFVAILEEAKQLHLRKTLDYGVDEDALSNIRSSADVVNMQPWAGCVLRMMDKMHRIKAFFRRGKVEFDGIEDTLMDILCYAAIALVFYRQTRKP